MCPARFLVQCKFIEWGWLLFDIIFECDAWIMGKPQFYVGDG